VSSRKTLDRTHPLAHLKAGDEEELKHILDAAANIPVNASERLLYLMRNDPASPLRGTEDSQ
jgi:hypothetical protein